MKPNLLPMKMKPMHAKAGIAVAPKSARRRGFALVITISLMVLLSLLAVGLLSLSTISIRNSKNGDAMATARANARIALALALGDLQKSLGPDQAISATSGLLSETPAKPNLTGAWQSWDYSPASAPDYAGEKQTRFRRWLVSAPSPADLRSADFASRAWPAGNSSIVLVGRNSLGGVTDPRAEARAGLVPVGLGGGSPGALAWHVSDESVKCRIHLNREPSEGAGLIWAKRALLSGQRPDSSTVTGLAGGRLDFLPKDRTTAAFTEAERMSTKMVSLGQTELMDGARAMGEFRNDVTPYSMGLLTNVRQGGLKQDLTSIFEFSGSALSAVLPPEFSTKRLYETTHKITGVSDPYWSALSTYYNSFRSITAPDTGPLYSARSMPNIPFTNPAPPTVYHPGPVIAKVETLFTYVTRDSHGPWREQSTGFKYMGHLIYTPLVTLHNPYNVNISFERMIVNIRNVPIAFSFFVNNIPQSSGLVPLTEMYVDGNNRREVEFVMEIADWQGQNSSTVRGPINLRPGQTLVCSPYIDPSATFGNGSGNFFDYRNNLTGDETTPIKARPGFYGRAVGFDIDWLTPNHAGWSSGQQNDSNRGVLLFHDTDRIHFEYAVRPPTQGLNTSFRVTAKIVMSGRTYDYGGMDFVYQDDRTLRRFFPEVHRYPTGRGSMTQAGTYAPNTEPISQHARAQSFALFSAQARTTSGGVYETGSRTPAAGAQNTLRNGRLAGRPFLFHNPARPIVNVNLTNEKPAAHSHELNFVPLPGQVDDIFEVDVTNRSNYLTGNTTLRGIKTGSYLELPTGPMQTIADFRRSNALTSSYLPGFVQPVSNSIASPLMSTSKVVERNTLVAPYDLLDHSVLANHALYDRFYFSTIATRPGSNLSPEAVFERFLNGSDRLPSQAFQAYLPEGSTADQAKTELFRGGKPLADAYQKAAMYQLLRGPFNVNSTSVQAWKAMLAGLRGNRAVTLWGRSGTMELQDVDGVPVLPMSMVNGGPAERVNVNSTQIDNARTNEWNGFRSLTDTQLEALASRIVEQVRSRGPFLSMSEFVNRRIGSESRETLRGALEVAIEEAGLNSTVFGQQVPIAAEHLANADLYAFRTPATSTGNPAAGAPGWINQGDLMRILEPAATVRSDTFVIRVCGEAHDASGRVIARAFAEAVAQRLPEYVDPVDGPELNVVTSSAASKVNKDFGRRFAVVSFRWLSADEI